MRDSKIPAPSWISDAFGIIVLGLFFVPTLIFGDEPKPTEIIPIEEFFEPHPENPKSQIPAPCIRHPERCGKVAVVQWAPYLPTPLGVTSSEAEAFKQNNRETLATYIIEAAHKGAELILTPEFAIVGYPDLPGVPAEEDEFRNREDIAPYVEPINGPSTQYFSQLAQTLGVGIHIGFAEVDPVTDFYYNVVVALAPNGQIAGTYRKINLFKGERNFLLPGTSPSTYVSPFGLLGFAICADIYSWNPMNAYKTAGVKLIALSTSWAQANTGMQHFREAALWSDAFVLAANQNYFPDSGVINPNGSLQSHIRQSDGVAYGLVPYFYNESDSSQDNTRSGKSP